MINEASEDSINHQLNIFASEANKEKLAKDKRLENCTLDKFSIDNKDFQTIKIQFRALGLIIKSQKQRSLRDSGTYWTLTPYGDDSMTRLLAIRHDNDKSISDKDILLGED